MTSIKQHNSRMVALLALITLFASILTLAPATPAGAQTRTCSSSDADADGDGWGWENNASCKVGAQTTSNNSGAICVDSDGDGWGWDGSNSCQVGGVVTSLDAPTNLRVVSRVSGTQIAVGWDPVDGADGYVLYRNGNVVTRTTSTAANVGSSNVPVTVKAHASNQTVWSPASASIRTQDEVAVATADKDEYGNPYCRSASSDDNGDGWGWENNTSCVVRSLVLAAKELTEIKPGDQVPIPVGQPILETPSSPLFSGENLVRSGEHHVIVVSPPFPAGTTVDELADAMNRTGLHPVHQFNDVVFTPGEYNRSHAGPGYVTTTALFDDNGNQVGVLNRTEPGAHLLHDGTVQRTIVRGNDGLLRIETVGVGTGRLGAPNAYLSTVIWDLTDASMHRWIRGLNSPYSITPQDLSNNGDDSDARVDAFGVVLNEQTDPDNDGISVFGDMDNDNDGFTGLDDPDDLNPNVPSNGGGDGDDPDLNPEDDEDEEPNTPTPIDPSEFVFQDSDGDGVPDDQDAYPNDNWRHDVNDRDGDGVLNADDAFPYDPLRSEDEQAVETTVTPPSANPRGNDCYGESGCPKQATHDANGRAYCESDSSDPDGDGWGWENNDSCVVR